MQYAMLGAWGHNQQQTGDISNKNWDTIVFGDHPAGNLCNQPLNKWATHYQRATAPLLPGKNLTVIGTKQYCQQYRN